MIKDKHTIINGLDYSEYINSPEWRAKRLEVADRANYKCERCGKPVYCGYHIHHKTYKRFGDENLSDLAFLCPDCHKKLHEKRDKKNANRRKRTKASCVYSQKQDGQRYCTKHKDYCTQMCKDYICRYTDQPYTGPKTRTLRKDVRIPRVSCSKCGGERVKVTQCGNTTMAYCVACGSEIRTLNSHERNIAKHYHDVKVR